MDIELARTFLEIIRCGSFVSAAESLHVTQTTVTARVHSLEGLLGCRLFVRNRSGASLTDNGRHFVANANQLVQTWEASRRDLPLPDGSVQLVSLGCEMSLWNPLLVRWVAALEKEYPALAVRVEVADYGKLHEKLQHGALDAALVHQPQYRPGMQVEELLEEKLIMVGSITNNESYIYVNWGDTFCRQHDTALPHYTRASINTNLGPLALQYILENGGRGYFRTRVVQRYIDDGLLKRLPDTPEFSYPVYLTHLLRSNMQPLNQAISILKKISREIATITF